MNLQLKLQKEVTHQAGTIFSSKLEKANTWQTHKAKKQAELFRLDGSFGVGNAAEISVFAKHCGNTKPQPLSPQSFLWRHEVLMGMLLPYWSEDQILRESELVERDTAPRPWPIVSDCHHGHHGHPITYYTYYFPVIEALHLFFSVSFGVRYPLNVFALLRKSGPWISCRVGGSGSS